MNSDRQPQAAGQHVGAAQHHPRRERDRAAVRKHDDRQIGNVAAQGGDPSEAVLPEAPVVRDVAAPRAGFVRSLDAIDIGLAALRLGAGRRTKDDAIDHAVGIRCVKKRGDAVASGDTLAEVHARDEAGAEAAAAEVLAAYELGDEAVPKEPIVFETIV